ncbi:MAG: hypothetical protein H6Q33_4648 [Deltaproteobacteria bacterium]|nr:hypothetical protein [Deltaproteobacteria bacterium]
MRSVSHGKWLTLRKCQDVAARAVVIAGEIRRFVDWGECRRSDVRFANDAVSTFLFQDAGNGSQCSGQGTYGRLTDIPRRAHVNMMRMAGNVWPVPRVVPPPP